MAENDTPDASNRTPPSAVGRSHNRQSVSKEDFAVLKYWVRDMLFEKVKFLYNNSVDLRVGNALYNKFVRDCNDRLVGLKNTAAGSEAERVYLELLWTTANGKNRNMVASGLTTRRSTVFSSMQNQFTGKYRRGQGPSLTPVPLLTPPTTPAATELCNFCVLNNAILPSLEAFEKRLEIPGIYFVFYDYFYKASAGDARWKEGCLEANTEIDRLGSRVGEAFAMLVLKNNYFAWLLEAKEKLGVKLVTDYDSDTQRRGMKNIVDALLQVEFDLPDAPLCATAAGSGGTETLEVPAVTSSNVLVVVKSLDEAGYNILAKKTEAALKATRRSSANGTRYSDIKKRAVELTKETAELAAAEASCGEDAEQTSEETRMQALEEAKEAKGERMKKRRKLLKTFREYTVRQTTEGKFKGWSKRASDEMTAISKKLAKEGQSGRSKMFNAAYRQVYGTRSNEKRKADEIDDEPVDYSELWDLDESEIAAV
jgi:hypothetical protein